MGTSLVLRMVPTDIKSILIREHHIENHQVHILIGQLFEPRLRVSGADEFELETRHILLQGCGEPFIIVDQQYPVHLLPLSALNFLTEYAGNSQCKRIGTHRTPP